MDLRNRKGSLSLAIGKHLVVTVVILVVVAALLAVVAIDGGIWLVMLLPLEWSWQWRS